METVNICCLHQHGIKIAYGSPTEVYLIKGLSSSVPKDVWQYWLSNNRDHQIVRAGLIFEEPPLAAATPSDDAAEAERAAE